MHILDFIMYFPIMGIIWFILIIVGGREFTEELGGAVIGVPVIIVCTIIYIIIFVFCGVDWIDIFHGVYNINFHNWFKL